MHSNFSPDLISAASDALLEAMGVPNKLSHPMADQFRNAPLSSLANIIGQQVNPRAAGSRQEAIAAALSSRDFSSVVAEVGNTFCRKRFNATAAHRAFCHPVVVPNFKPVAIADFSVSTQLERIGEAAEVTPSRIRTTEGHMANLFSYAAALLFSRETVYNDELQGIANILAAYGSTAARTEAKLVYYLLETNPVLGDASPMFHAEFGNIVAETLSAVAIRMGMAALRKGPALLRNEGDLADLPAAHLIVSAELEYTAFALNHDIGDRMLVTASANLPNGRWYLLPPVDVQPVVGTLQLAGTREPVRIEQGKKNINHDGFAMKASADLGAVALSRFAVRGGV